MCPKWCNWFIRRRTRYVIGFSHYKLVNHLGRYKGAQQHVMYDLSTIQSQKMFVFSQIIVYGILSINSYMLCEPSFISTNKMGFTSSASLFTYTISLHRRSVLLLIIMTRTGAKIWIKKWGLVLGAYCHLHIPSTDIYMTQSLVQESPQIDSNPVYDFNPTRVSSFDSPITSMYISSSKTSKSISPRPY